MVTGSLAGLGVGYALQRSQLCFHSALVGAATGSPRLLRGWVLAVAVAALGFAVLLLLPGTEDLNRGLPLRPVGNVAGGVMIGVGMVVAASCISGLFFKLGAGMVGASVGLTGWATGELLARQLDVRGPTWVTGGVDATVPGALGLPRLPVALLVLVVVVVLLHRRETDDPAAPGWQWRWTTTGIGLGAAVTAAWALAAAGGSSYGASSVGAVSSVADGDPNSWLLAFLGALVVGSAVAARTAGGWRLRGETMTRLLGLAVGGVLLGAGGWIAGGCNLGHGRSGGSQLSISSLVVVASMAAGVAAARTVIGQRTTS